MDKETRTWAMLLHLSLLLGFAFPLIGFVAPILIWQLKKAALPGIDAHGRMILNYMLSMFLYGIAATAFSLIGLGTIVGLALLLVGIVFPCVGAIKANDGMLWRYPLMLNLIR